MTHYDTQMMADDADGNPPATPWCYPHLGETRGYSKAVTFSGRARGWVSARATPVELREAAERVMKPSRVRWPFGATRRFLTLSHWTS